MKNTILLILLFLISFTNLNSQTIKKQSNEIVLNQGIPTCPNDSKITELINKVGINNLLKSKKNITKSEANVCREIGVLLNKRGSYDAADWYLERVKGYVDVVELAPEVVFETPKDEVPEVDEVSADVAASLAKDKEFLSSLPKSYDNVSPSDMKKLANEIEGKLQKLIEEKEQLLKNGESKDVINAKDETIKTLGKEKKIIGLNLENGGLKVETKDLKVERNKLKMYLIWASIILFILVLTLVVLTQRKTIKVQDVEIESQLRDINKKNTYLEYAARIIRHDMHSGINTYIPRGLSSLEKRISVDEMNNLKITSPIKMIKDGLAHTQKVYKSVYEFTNLVKHTVVLDRDMVDIKESLLKYLTNTSYKNQVELDDLVTLNVNETLFWNAIDNLIKNGLRYNNSDTKIVKIYMENNDLIVEDNGIGFTQKEFENVTGGKIKKDADSESGLGLGITKTILEEHGFNMEFEKLETGTKIKIKINK
jgi:light-regulated signal transduction histidine kinase (bacteriophytochrome)